MTPEVELLITEARPRLMGMGMVLERPGEVALGIPLSQTRPRPIATMMIIPLMIQRRVPTTILELQDTTKKAQALPIPLLHQDPYIIRRRVILLISLLHLPLVAINLHPVQTLTCRHPRLVKLINLHHHRDMGHLLRLDIRR